MQEINISKLNEFYKDAETVDQDIFSEQRSNVLLVAGEHYSRRNSKYWNRIRDSKDLSNEQKLRITKNHIQRIVKTYQNNIVSHAPGVKVVPTDEKELSHQKAAQLNNSVWAYAKQKHNLKKLTHTEAKDFIDLGEVACKVYWDPNAGKFLGWKAETDEAGNPVMDESGQMVASKTPAFTGDLVFERILAFNLLRDASAKSMDDSKFLIYRKMVNVDALKSMVDGDEEKLKAIQETKDQTFVVFDGNNQQFHKTNNETLLREFYFRPCHAYPMGYFYICVENAILFEGELPFGIMPIIYEGFDEIQTSARHRSIVKVLRPYQAELNRAASKIAEHQVTLGDDKILVQSGTKITTGIHLPGVRSIQYSGMAPTILAGRTGDQYVTYMAATISEMYEVANVKEDSSGKDVKADPYAALFQSLRDKKKFSLYAEKFEGYQQKKCKTYLELARHYFDANMLIPMVGKNEYVNIEEFKRTSDQFFMLKTEPVTDDIETMMGKQLTINHVLQYVGPQMDKESIGKLIRTMPLGNLEQSFSDLTMDYDSATNMILAMDRGEEVEPNRFDDHTYMIKRLVGRMRLSDFKMLDPMIQERYNTLLQIYEQLEVQRQEQIMAAKAGYIPSGGARIKVDYYVPDPNNAARTIRATLPAESIDWLMKRLAEQGSSQEMLTQMNQGAVEDMAAMINQGQGTALQGSDGGREPMPNPANTIRGGYLQ